jgi:hypothetical protein
MRAFYIVNDVINIDPLILDLPINDTLVVHIDIWEINTVYKKISWSKYKASFIDFEENHLVIVGMNRIRTEASRYDMVYSHIYKLRKYESKVVIDEHPFTGEPWRLWYVYGFLYHTWIAGENSMAIQRSWTRWFERETKDCPISEKSILNHIGDTYSDKELLTTEFILRPVDLFENGKYEEVKRIAFEKNDTPRLIVNEMVKNLGLEIGYESYLENRKIVLPDFGISRFLIEENERRMGTYNAIIKYGRANFKR